MIVILLVVTTSLLGDFTFSYRSYVQFPAIPVTSLFLFETFWKFLRWSSKWSEYWFQCCHIDIRGPQERCRKSSSRLELRVIRSSRRRERPQRTRLSAKAKPFRSSSSLACRPSGVKGRTLRVKYGRVSRVWCIYVESICIFHAYSVVHWTSPANLVGSCLKHLSLQYHPMLATGDWGLVMIGNWGPGNHTTRSCLTASEMCLLALMSVDYPARFQTPVWIVNMKWCTCMRDESFRFRLSDSFQELSNFEDGMLGTLTCDQPGLEGGILKETIGSEALNACPIHQLRMVIFPNYLSKVLWLECHQQYGRSITIFGESTYINSLQHHLTLLITPCDWSSDRPVTIVSQK